ncbi:hypothetical protein [Bacillus vallismortis]|uniref:hypothetical protein n=1 Tax=Bacillus vallismortis TaxID=72361 RepID=UPI00227F5A77|nr:hypothetical protein [Bacillus vallismortis]MCY8310016.1 hypothetical protein [Bacillus vallismortis]MCY8598956.1 hypothetical protein [Bacillus vallismortis]
MSLVSIIARENFITVMTDGRVTSEGEAIQEDYKKFIQLNKDMFFAFAGSKEPCEFVARWAKDYFKQYGLNKLASAINGFVLNNNLNKYKILAGFGGVDSKRVKLFTYSSLENKLNEFIPEGYHDIKYAFLYNSSTENNDLNLTEILTNGLRKHGFNTSNKCLKAQKELNEMVASKEFGVNNITFDLTIKNSN